MLKEAIESQSPRLPTKVRLTGYQAWLYKKK